MAVALLGQVGLFILVEHLAKYICIVRCTFHCIMTGIRAREQTAMSWSEHARLSAPGEHIA